MKSYKKRIADAILTQKLESAGAVLIEGAKWCGKTTTAEHAAKSAAYIADPTAAEQNILLSRIRPNQILDGEYPRLLDEWQIAPALRDAVRFDVDHSGELGKFILTGSAVPCRTDEIRHTGTGRFAWLKMRPMALWESGESSGDVSLSGLFDTGKIDGAVPFSNDLEHVSYLICRGGWPQAASIASKSAALAQAFNYVDAVAESDVSRTDNIKRNPHLVRRILKSYARLQGTQANASIIKADIFSAETGNFNDDTLYAYLNALRKIFVVEDMEAWCPNLRTKTAIRSSPTRYFVDPSIAAASMGVGPNDLLNDLTAFGLLFETMAIRDLRVYSQALNGEVRHYLDRSGLECDAVIHLRDGRYALVEIKTGGKELVDKGAASLETLSKKIAASGKIPLPSFRMILTAVGSTAYPRPDGIIVCPITALRP